MWHLEFGGSHTPPVTLEFEYDESALLAGIDELELAIYQHNGDAWKMLPSSVDPVANTVTATTDVFTLYALGLRPDPCPADLNGDGVVNAADLAIVLTNWGPCPAPCPADLNGDGVVGPTDLATLLTNWGPCP